MDNKNLKLPVLFTLFFISNIALAQKGKSKQFDLKLYYNFKYLIIEDETTDSINIYNSRLKSFLFGNLCPSLLIYNERSMHEFEISAFNFGTTDYRFTQTRTSINQKQLADGYKQFFFNLNIKYEYIFRLSDKEKNYGVMLGTSVEPYIHRDIFLPLVSKYYLTKQFTLGGKFYIIPRGIIPLKKKFYIDINIPIEIIDLNWKRTYVDNPGLSEDLRSTNNYENAFFRNLFQFRIGLGIKLQEPLTNEHN